MHRNIIFFLKVAFLILFILPLLNGFPSLSYESMAKKQDNEPRALPISSFVKIEGKLITKYCEGECGDNEKSTADIFHGSGIAIGKEKVLTAGHLCEEYIQLSNEFLMFPDVFQTLITDENVSINELSFQVYTNEGKRYVSEIVDYDMSKDLCLLNVPELDVEIAEISTMSAHIGEKVYALSAPFGIFSPGMTLIFEGFYSGDDEEGNSFYTIPTKPGSSGSAILNRDGQIVGIIHAAILDIENVAVGSDLSDIRIFLNGKKTK